MNDTTNHPHTEAEIQILTSIPETYQTLRTEMSRKIIGQEEAIRDLFIALLANGHCLMIGVPGLAKTLIVRTLAEVLALDFHRIQFTPDLMPSDITGSEILEETETGGRLFRFVQGPIFTQMLLADEINRTPPKTQAALLEAMQEGRVTVAGQTHTLNAPFFVLATQNPIEQEGTYPLPEAQLDRFMFCLHVGYPSVDQEVRIMCETTSGKTEVLSKVIDAEKILALQKAVRTIHVPSSVARYGVKLVCATRPQDPSAPGTLKHYLQWGAGPRASQYLALAGKVRAAMDGRFNVANEDISAVAHLVLRHRLITNYHAEADGITPDQLVTRLLENIRP